MEANFFNFPNPFGSSARTETQFHYYLEDDSEVVIRIYTLLGELVWSRKYNADTDEGQAGVHDGLQKPTIEWQGTNDKNQRVLNGVYVAVLRTSTGSAYTKVAVAK